MSKLRLYHYWRSSSSWRVRWAFALKGIKCEFIGVNLLSDEPESEAHRQRNPLGYVPALEFLSEKRPERKYLTESVAIIEWAEEIYPTPKLIPGDSFQRAWIRQLVQVINADTQPLQNLSPQEFHSSDPEKRKAWAQHWIRNGLQAYEILAKKSAGQFSVGDEVTMADLFLVPQCYNAIRYEVSPDDYPTIAKIYRATQETEGYRLSAPERFQSS